MWTLARKVVIRQNSSYAAAKLLESIEDFAGERTLQNLDFRSEQKQQSTYTEDYPFLDNEKGCSRLRIQLATPLFSDSSTASPQTSSLRATSSILTCPSMSKVPWWAYTLSLPIRLLKSTNL